MVCEIMRDEAFLAQPSLPAAPEDVPVAQDLLETLQAHKDGCVGMAANMIGISKRIIAFECDGGYMVMFNPEIIRKSEPYEAEEGCLSLTGTRKTTRYETIEVEYRDVRWNKRKGRFSGFTAQIIQHEADHLEGILI